MYNYTALLYLLIIHINYLKKTFKVWRVLTFCDIGRIFARIGKSIVISTNEMASDIFLNSTIYLLNVSFSYSNLETNIIMLHITKFIFHIGLILQYVNKIHVDTHQHIFMINILRVLYVVAIWIIGFFLYFFYLLLLGKTTKPKLLKLPFTKCHRCYDVADSLLHQGGGIKGLPYLLSYFPLHIINLFLDFHLNGLSSHT